MARGASARRYSQAVFEIALEQNELEAWKADLNQIAAVLVDPELVSLLESPKLPFSHKDELLSERLKGVRPLALNLARILVTKGRLRLAGQIAVGYEQLVDAYYGIEHAEVTTAILLDDVDKETLASHLGTLVGKRLTLEIRVDPLILGGVSVRLGNKLIDGSTRARLESLRQSLTKAG